MPVLTPANRVTVGGAGGLNALVTRRTALIQSIWGTTTLPTTEPHTVTASYGGRTLPTGCASITRMQHNIVYGGTAETELLFPTATWNGRLIVMHSGHWEDHRTTTTQSPLAMEYFLAKGFRVVAACMPCSGFNPNPLTLTIAATPYVNNTNHDFSHVDAAGTSSARVFLLPVVEAINYAIRTQAPAYTYMFGISGGGWTAHMVAAMDPRITWSCNLFGSMPISMRLSSGGPGDNSDYEQFQARSWMSAVDGPGAGYYGYERIYSLCGASDQGAPRRHLQILGDYEPVFPARTVRTQIDTYIAACNAEVSRQGGKIRWWNNTAVSGHNYDATTLDEMWNDIRSFHPV